MKQDKSITTALNKIELVENTVEKIGKFIRTKRGSSFVNSLHTAPFRELCRRYNVPKFILLFNNDTRNLNLVEAAINKYGALLPDPPKIVRLEVPKQPKTAIKLTVKESKAYNKAHSPRKMGFAALMHAYEEHKMKKFENRHPAPTEKELAEDLFPDELKAGWKTMMNIHREHVRNLLCKIYANTEKQERDYRVFKVLSITVDPATGQEHKPVVSEVELDRPFLGNQSTSKKDIALRLKALAHDAREGDSNVIRVKLYKKTGELVRSVNFVKKAA